VVILLLVSKKNVEVVVPEDTLSMARLDKALHLLHNSGAVGSTVGQIAKKNESSSFLVCPVSGVSQFSQEIMKSFDLTVNVAHDVDGTVEEALDQRFQRHTFGNASVVVPSKCQGHQAESHTAPASHQTAHPAFCNFRSLAFRAISAR
jgi:hypothetical protein